MPELIHRQKHIADALTLPLAASSLEVLSLQPLGGGAIQENWALDARIDGRIHELVLRTDAPSTLPWSLSRAQEFAVLRAAFAAGVTVPEPLALVTDQDVIGQTFAIMPRLQGTALGPKIVKDRSICPDREQLVERLGREMAIIHKIKPDDVDLPFLGEVSDDPAGQLIAELRHYLDQMALQESVLEWGLRWCELHKPAAYGMSLVHQDFRTGNLLLGQEELAAVLDWEFSRFGDPMSDVGWFFARCWRYSRPDLRAGGLGEVEAFARGYRSISGRDLDFEAITFWEVMAHLRWAVIALQQARRHLDGGQNSLELALTGCILPELETEILAMTKPSNWRAS